MKKSVDMSDATDLLDEDKALKEVIFIESRVVIAFAAIYEGVYELVGRSSFFKRF